MNNWRQRYGEWALVTGGARGIGRGFAEGCAHRGMNLILADRLQDTLTEAGKELAEAHGVEVITVCTDLGQESFLDDIRALTQGLEVGVLVNNAACGTVGPFLQTDEASLRLQLQVNLLAPMRLIQAYAPAMVERGRGAIINVSSRTGEMGNPYFASYAASKAWMSNFSETLWYELKDSGVDVFTLKPDQTATPGYLAYNPGAYGDGIQSIEDCVAAAFEGIGQGMSCIPLESGRQADAALKAMPREEAVASIGDGMKQVFSALLKER